MTHTNVQCNLTNKKTHEHTWHRKKKLLSEECDLNILWMGKLDYIWINAYEARNTNT